MCLLDIVENMRFSMESPTCSVLSAFPCSEPDKMDKMEVKVGSRAGAMKQRLETLQLIAHSDSEQFQLLLASLPQQELKRLLLSGVANLASSRGLMARCHDILSKRKRSETLVYNPQDRTSNTLST